MVRKRAYRILEALARTVLPTAGIRRAVGFDPHPTLGRLRDRGAVVRVPYGWKLTPLGVHLYHVGRLERLS